MLKKLLPVVSIFVFIIGFSIFMYSLFNQKSEFKPPSAELNAQTGVFAVPEDLGWTELYQDGMPYRFSICGITDSNNADLPVWFYNDVNNKALLVLEVYDTNENLLAKSGFLKPDEYLESIKLSRVLQEDETVVYKIIGYEIDTYESLGSVNLTTTLLK